MIIMILYHNMMIMISDYYHYDDPDRHNNHLRHILQPTAIRPSHFLKIFPASSNQDNQVCNMFKILIFHCGVSHIMPQASPQLSQSSWLMLCTVFFCYLLFQHPFTSRQFFSIVSWPISILGIITSTWQWKTLTLDDVFKYNLHFHGFSSQV